MFSFVQVGNIVLVCIRLTLERDITVSLAPVSVLAQSKQKLQSVPDEEWKDKHFFLLLTMNLFVIDKARCYLIAISNN